MPWTLTIAGTTKNLADWKVNDVALTQSNLSVDLLTFNAPRAVFDGDALCSFGAAIVLTDPDGVVRFRGQRQLVPGDLSNQSESQGYTFAGPWRWLAQNVFQQLWNGIYTPHLIFRYGVGFNIKAVLDYAIANGAGLQYVQAELDALAVIPPANECTEKFCASCILDNLQFVPDCVTWFDYATNPPTLHLQRRGALSAANLRLASYTTDETLPKIAQLRLVPRPDLQIPSAKINFERINTVDGVQYLVPSVDVYPLSATGREDRAFNATVLVQGSTVVNLFAEIECETIDVNSVAWWKRHVATLDSSAVDIFAGPENISRVDREGNPISVTYDQELMPGKGTLAPWMTLVGGTLIEWQTEVVKAAFFVEIFEIDPATGVPDVTPVRTETREYSVELITTNAPAGVSEYSAVGSTESGDPDIVGLAQYLYDSLSTLHYEGEIALMEQECTFSAGMGSSINILGSRSEYLTMSALVQEVRYNIDSGQTSLILGPPKHLGLSDLLALLQRFRVRRRWTNPDTQTTGQVGAAQGDLELGKATGATNSVSGSGSQSLLIIKNANRKLTSDAGNAYWSLTGDVGDGSVTIRLSDTAGREIFIREVGVCVGGVTKHMLVLGSEIY